LEIWRKKGFVVRKPKEILFCTTVFPALSRIETSCFEKFETEIPLIPVCPN
jgi:hypothetical protein